MEKEQKMQDVPQAETEQKETPSADVQQPKARRRMDCSVSGT